MTSAPCRRWPLNHIFLFSRMSACEVSRASHSAGLHVCRGICDAAGHVYHASGAEQLSNGCSRRPGQYSPIGTPGGLHGPSAAALAASVACCGICPTIPAEPNSLPAAPPPTRPWLCGSLPPAGGWHGAVVSHSRSSRVDRRARICRPRFCWAGLPCSCAARLARDGAAGAAGQPDRTAGQPNRAARSASHRPQWLSTQRHRSPRGHLWGGWPVDPPASRGESRASAPAAASRPRPRPRQSAPVNAVRGRWRLVAAVRPVYSSAFSDLIAGG